MTPKYSHVDLLHTLTEIYHSDIPITLKHDCACRIIAQTLDAHLVSFFEYSGNEDQLKCVGNFINFDSVYPIYHEKGTKYQAILENISVYEYCDYIEQSDHIQNIKESGYKENKVFYNKPSQSHFQEITEHFAHSSTAKVLYRRYKEKIKSEKYSINDSYPTSRYYKALLKGKNSTTVIALNNISKEKRLCCSVFEKKLGIGINDDSVYVAIPLVSGKRSFGLVRILFSPDNQLIMGNMLQSESKLLCESISQILSLHLNVQYLFEGYKNIARTELNDLVPNSLDKECNLLASVINCRGVLIRLGIIPNSIPKLVGRSEQMQGFANWIKENGDFYSDSTGYNSVLRNLFYPHFANELPLKNESASELLALRMKFEKEPSSNLLHIKEQSYYYLENKTLKETLDSSFLENHKHQSIDLYEFFSDQILRMLAEQFDVYEIVILKIPKVDSGLATFVSSVNRRFDKEDIDLMYSVLQKLGYEIKHLTDEARKVDLSTRETSELIVHQLTAPINAVEQLTATMTAVLGEKWDADKKMEFLSKNLHYLLNKTQFAKQQIKTIEKFLQWEKNGIIPSRVQAYRLIDYLKKKAHLYRDLAHSKGIQIYVFEDNSDFLDQIDFDSKMIDEILNCMLDNAVKYCYRENELKKNNIEFDPKYVNSDGHIHIGVNSNKEKLILEFVNWGCAIDTDEYEQIFSFKRRGKYAHIMTTAGNGIGLYMVKKIVDAFSGSATVNHQNHKTVFTLTFPR